MKKILIIDDIKEQRQIAARTIEKLGLAVKNELAEENNQ